MSVLYKDRETIKNTLKSIVTLCVGEREEKEVEKKRVRFAFQNTHHKLHFATKENGVINEDATIERMGNILEKQDFKLDELQQKSAFYWSEKEIYDFLIKHIEESDIVDKVAQWLDSDETELHGKFGIDIDVPETANAEKYIGVTCVKQKDDSEPIPFRNHTMRLVFASEEDKGYPFVLASMYPVLTFEERNVAKEMIGIGQFRDKQKQVEVVSKALKEHTIDQGAADFYFKELFNKMKAKAKTNWTEMVADIPTIFRTREMYIDTAKNGCQQFIENPIALLGKRKNGALEENLLYKDKILLKECYIAAGSVMFKKLVNKGYSDMEALTAVSDKINTSMSNIYKSISKMQGIVAGKAIDEITEAIAKDNEMVAEPVEEMKVLLKDENFKDIYGDEIKEEYDTLFEVMDVTDNTIYICGENDIYEVDKGSVIMSLEAIESVQEKEVIELETDDIDIAI